MIDTYNNNTAALEFYVTNPSDDYKAFVHILAEHLRARREACCLTQADLAARIGKSESQIDRYETADPEAGQWPSLYILREIMNELSIDPRVLFGMHAIPAAHAAFHYSCIFNYKTSAKNESALYWKCPACNFEEISYFEDNAEEYITKRTHETHGRFIDGFTFVCDNCGASFKRLYRW